MRRSLAVAVAVLAVSAPIAQAADPVYVRDPLSNKLSQHPRKLSFSDVDMTGLKWIHWGQAKAIAKGKANVLICDPNCAGGHRETHKVRVVVSKRTTEDGKRVYRCIAGKVSGVPKAYSRISWMC